MTSRTPIRLTPHRGPLATPSTSPESSPTSSTPPSDFSCSSVESIPTLDVAILQYRISTLNLPPQNQFQSGVDRRGHELFDGRSYLCALILALENLLHSVYDLAATSAGIITFCLLIWGLLEWSSYISDLHRQPSPWLSVPRLPLPTPAGDLRCHVNSSLCEPRDQHSAVLQFLSEQIQHANALSSLSVSLGLPLHAFFEAHRASISRAVAQHDLERPHMIQGVDTLANLTEFLGPSHSLLDFTSGSFVGRSLTLALDELNGLTSKHVFSRGSSAHGNARLYAIYWRTTSNLLLEYSAARSRSKTLSQHLHVLHRQLSQLISSHHATGDISKMPSIWRWKDIVRRPATSTEGGIQSFVTGLEATLDNIHRLTAYLDWITEQLAQTTLEDVLRTQHEADFSSCMMSLQELFTRSWPSTPKRLCFCLNDSGAALPAQPERVEISIPGSPTVRAGR